MRQLDIFDPAASEHDGRRGAKAAEYALMEWREKAEILIASLWKGYQFTADDLVKAVGLPTYEDGRPNNNGVGGFVQGLAKRGLVRHVGYTNSGRVSNHARVLRVWEVI